MNRDVRRMLSAAKDKCTEEQRKNREKEMSRNSKEAYNTRKAVTKTQQHKSAVIEDSSRNTLTDSTAVLSQWTGYCSDLYNYELHRDTSLLQSNQSLTKEAESLPVPREAVEEAVHNPRAGVDNIPSELR